MQQNPFEAFKNAGSRFAEIAEEEFQLAQVNQSVSPLYAALSEHDQSRALRLASELKIHIYENVLAFGLQAQQALRDFTANMAVHIHRKDHSKVGEVLAQLISYLEQINPDALVQEEKGFLSKFFSKQKQSTQEVMTHYKRMSKQIDRLAIQLEHAQMGLLRDFKLLNDLYKLNEQYFAEINVYIAAGELKLVDVKKQLPNIEPTEPMALQQLNDQKMAIEWLDRRLYDMQISREIAIQAAPQIRLMQQTNQLLIDKIQASVMTTIPMWQTQISTLLTMNQQRRVAEAQDKLMRASDELARKNGKMLQMKSKQAGISHSDIDQFKQTQLKLVQDIEETLRVHAKTNDVFESM
ncbi:toxic anion resistance protein [Metasolibacillus meyeri]|uniref:Toxic anion resistance protein n=1 Tax=Metasolibacillus meyeri TaxID=1071052 RepID=A0AAW9NMK3_9BACL|nr:toxic anion resistance protein [Metasolibacillus meyeri]MEC1177029.1 toxic anion resistance protein [Metasolibacillus meyeri]